jgi:hypothetical protein
VAAYVGTWNRAAYYLAHGMRGTVHGVFPAAEARLRAFVAKLLLLETVPELAQDRPCD